MKKAVHILKIVLACTLILVALLFGITSFFIPGQVKLFTIALSLLMVCAGVLIIYEVQISSASKIKMPIQNMMPLNYETPDSNGQKLSEPNTNAAPVKEMLVEGTAKKELSELNRQIDAAEKELSHLNSQIDMAKKELPDLNYQIDAARKELISYQSEISEIDNTTMLQSWGMYTPEFLYDKSDEYKIQLLAIRQEQKTLIREHRAVSGNTNWTVNNSLAQGRKMVEDMQKLLLRAFNAECDSAVEHIKYSNLDASLKKLERSVEAITNLGTVMGILVTPEYYKLKLDELRIAYEYQVKKQQEKDELKEARARMREEAKVAKELEEARACLKNRKRRLFAHKRPLSASKILVVRKYNLRFSP